MSNEKNLSAVDKMEYIKDEYSDEKGKMLAIAEFYWRCKSSVSGGEDPQVKKAKELLTKWDQPETVKTALQKIIDDNSRPAEDAGKIVEEMRDRLGDTGLLHILYQGCSKACGAYAANNKDKLALPE
jgi:hypothetical protein